MLLRRIYFAPLALFAFGVGSMSDSARAVNFVLDYSYDAANNFFGAGNPNGAAAGAQAKAALEASASFYSGILTDTLSAISKPANYQSSSGGIATWSWSTYFYAPNTGALTELTTPPTIAADEYRIYVGARSLPDGVLGEGGAGGAGRAYNPVGNFNSGDVATLNAITANFSTAVDSRQETVGFASWGGSLAFDRDGSTAWHYNHTTLPAAGTNDFYSVAIHELGHALGLGSDDIPEWANLATGATYAGLASKAAYGGVAPPLNPARDHWASGTNSVILGTTIVQEAAMDPELTQGTRKRLTALDAGGLTDLGWTVVAPSYNSLDFNFDGIVNGPDLAIWKAAYGSTTAGNADGDSDTDGNDFLLWQRRLGKVGAISPNGSAVPEPASAAMLLGCAILISARKIRRLAERPSLRRRQP